MKKLFSLFSFVLLSLSVFGQTMYVCQGNLRTAVKASEAGNMRYTGGTTLTISGYDFDTSEIDSIVFDNKVFNAQQVCVAYDGADARVVIPIALRTVVSVAGVGSDVALTSSASSDPEIDYVLSGSSDDGSFTMNGSYKCTVTLNGLNLTSNKGAAVDIENGKRIAIVLSDGTSNVLVDAADGSQDACLFVKGHPEFEGSGSLTITGNAKHAIKSDEYMLLKRTVGTIDILSAKSDGIHTGQYFKMNGGKLKVRSTLGDCVQAEITKDNTDELNGQLMIHGGALDLEVPGEDVKGLKSDSLMTITGGEIKITASGNGSKGISSGTDLVINSIDSTPVFTISATGGQWIDPAGIDNSKCMGIKVSGNMKVSAGTLNVSATGTKSKSIKVDGNLYISTSATINSTPGYEVGGSVVPL